MSILIIDDDTGICELIRERLENNSFETYSVQSSGKAIAYLENNSPDLMILDYSLPDMNGKEFIEELGKRKQSFPPYIVSTGRGDEKLAVVMMKLGARDYVVKDISFLDILPEVVRKVNKEIETEKKLKKTEDSLRDNEIKQRAMIDNISDVIQIINKNWIITYNSLNSLKWFGWEQEELVGSDIWTSIHQDDLQFVQEKFYSLLAKNNGEITLEYRYKCKDGSYKPIELTAVNLTNDPIISGVLVNFHDITTRKQAEEKLNKSLREKETLLRELYHRTKNTMQLILSMLVLQSKKFSKNKELQQLISDTDLRIQTISLVHQILYTSKDLSRISIKEYIHKLSDLIMKSFKVSEKTISVDLKIEDQYFLLDTAIPLGLILSELMSNSLKYAFPRNRQGKIMITLNRGDSGNTIFKYFDNGIGVTPEFDFRKQETLGLQYIISIGEQDMEGKVTFENNNGISCILEFPTTLYHVRV